MSIISRIRRGLAASDIFVPFFVASMVALGATSHKAEAATITNYAPWNAVNIQGAIEPGDEVKLVDALIKTNPTKTVTFILNSPGGDLGTVDKMFTALSYMEEHHIAYNTFVGKTDVCASACVMLWSAGAKRFVTVGGQLWVHAATAYNRAEGMEKASGTVETPVTAAWTVMTLRLFKATGAPATVLAKALEVKPEGNLIGYPEVIEWGGTMLDQNDGHALSECFTVPENALAIRCNK